MKAGLYAGLFADIGCMKRGVEFDSTFAAMYDQHLLEQCLTCSLLLQVVSQLLRASGKLVSQAENGAAVVIQNANHPTAEGQPWIIRYSVTDAAGNAADPVLRLVHFSCPKVGMGYCGML